MAEENLGRIISGKYRLIALLGEGAMGMVYRVEQLDAEGQVLREAALKMIQPEFSCDPEFFRRFLREARMAARLRSPNAVTVYESGQAEEGQLYYTMELIQGVTLKEVLQSEGRLPVERTVRIVEQICEALSEAHTLPEPIVHRDLKPANIFVEQRQERDWVKVGDFGIAKTLGEESGGLTRTGASLGTPLYMAPEQWMGKDIDGRADLYALGIVTYELLTGRPPFSSSEGPVALMYQHLQETPAPLPPSVPAAVRLQVERLLAKSPQDRSPDALSVRRALEAAVPRGDKRSAIVFGGGKRAPLEETGVFAGEPSQSEEVTRNDLPEVNFEQQETMRPQVVARGDGQSTAILVEKKEAPLEESAVFAREASPSAEIEQSEVIEEISRQTEAFKPQPQVKTLFKSKARRPPPWVYRAVGGLVVLVLLIGVQYENAFIGSVVYGVTPIVDLFLAAGIDPNTEVDEGEAVLVRATKLGHATIVEALLARGAEANAKDKDGNTALVWAARRGNTALAGTLLDKGANANARDQEGETALMRAARLGPTDIVATLLDKGADANARDQEGETALMWAAGLGHTAVVETLLDKGADADIKDKDGNTALVWAARLNHTAVVETLLNKGAQVNMQDKNGETALMRAARLGHSNVVQTLLNGNADIHVRAKDGNTALLIAKAAKYSQVVQLLRKAGARE